MFGFKPTEVYGVSPKILIFLIINVLLIVLFTLFIFKKRLNNINILSFIIYLLFFIIMWIVIVLFNKKVLIPVYTTHYYLNFILIGYTILNIHSLLFFENKKPIKK
jgi:hypothetical protein